MEDLIMSLTCMHSQCKNSTSKPIMCVTLKVWLC